MHYSDTVTYQVWSVIRESYAPEMTTFTARNLKRWHPALAHLEEDRPEGDRCKSKTSRVSASLFQLYKAGAIVLVEKIQGENYYVTDSETIMLWSPKMSYRSLGLSRMRKPRLRSRLVVRIPSVAEFLQNRFERVQ